MARIRSIKPEFFDDPDVGQLSAEASLVFIGIWTQADKRGRVLDDPRRLKVRLRPYASGDFDATLAELVDAGFVIRYQSSDGVRLLQVRSFEKHQKTHKLEPDSIYPGPNVSDTSPTGKKPSDPPVSCLLSLGSGLLSREVCGKPSEPAFPPAVLVFDVTGKGEKSWALTADHLADLQRDFEHTDVLTECKRASAWVKANPNRRKTAKGMAAFLVNWLNRAVANGGSRPSSVPHRPAQQPAYDSDWFAECQRLHANECDGQMKHAIRMQVEADA